MDDGSHGVDKNKTTGKITSHSFHLYTYTNLEDTNNIIEMLNSKFGITMYKIKRVMKDGSIKYYLKCCICVFAVRIFGEKTARKVWCIMEFVSRVRPRFSDR